MFRQLIQETVPQAISSCQNPRCDDPEHLAEIDSFVKAFIDDINEAAIETIPKTQPKPGNVNQKKMAGWKDYVEPYQDAAQFWYSIWTSAGKPRNTVLHESI